MFHSDKASFFEALEEELPLSKPSLMLESKKKSQITLALNVIQSCNLSCDYCFAKGGDYGKPSLMSFETATKSLETLSQDYDSVHVKFFGGEPLLNYRLIRKIILWCHRKKSSFSFSMTTNGTLLNEEKLSFFKEHRVALTISYDGALAQKTQRKAPLLENKLKKYEDQLKNFHDLTLRATCFNADSESLSSLLRELGGRFSLAVAYAKSDSFLESEGELQEKIKNLKSSMMNFILFMKEKGKIELCLKLFNLSYLVFKIQNHKKIDRFCGAGLDYFALSASGDYFPCHRFNEDKRVKLGNIKSGLKPLSDSFIEAFRSRKKEPCHSCWVQNLCQGGCLHEHNLELSKNPFFCEIQRMEVELALFYIKNIA